jgi:hypothetical protein
MYHFVKIIVALAVLVCVFVIFVAPSVDLPDTNLRGRQFTTAMLQSITTLLLIALMMACASMSAVRVPAFARASRPSSQLTC